MHHRHIETMAWVLPTIKDQNASISTSQLELRSISFSVPADEELLVEPVYGCWEGNMTHALMRDPIDIGELRREDYVVLGNAGVIRILSTGRKVRNLREGQLCLLFGSGEWDNYGYMKKAFAYDAEKTIGLMAKRTKVHWHQCIPIPEKSPLSLKQWAAFSLRYVTAWANWEVAIGAWRLQMDEARCRPIIWGWGGGTSFAELSLAHILGYQTYMLTSRDDRRTLIEQHGITPVDRRAFGDLAFDESRYHSDPMYRSAYTKAEAHFLDAVHQHTDGQGASIFIDHIGGHVHRATLKALGRQGVLATAGWKTGMRTTNIRAIECIHRHIHVHTHFARHEQACAAVSFAKDGKWSPPISDNVTPWDHLPQLADQARRGDLEFFPIYQINDL